MNTFSFEARDLEMLKAYEHTAKISAKDPDFAAGRKWATEKLPEDGARISELKRACAAMAPQCKTFKQYKAWFYDQELRPPSYHKALELIQIAAKKKPKTSRPNWKEKKERAFWNGVETDAYLYLAHFWPVAELEKYQDKIEEMAFDIFGASRA